MALISVVIPCYNAGSYICGTLEALEKQTFRDFNVILVDDCSGDDTAQVIADYAAQSQMEIIYAKNEQNAGPAVCRNHGIGLSDATYICFCDSDDWYDEDYLSSMVEMAQNTQADMTFCGYRVAFADGKQPLEHPLPTKAGALDKEGVLLLNVDSLWCLMIKRNLAAQFPLPNLRNGEDMAVLPVWMMHAQRFAAVPQAMYNYLLRKDSLSNKTSMRVVDSLVASFAYIQQNAEEAYRPQITYIGIRNLVYGALLNLFKYCDDVQRAKQILDDFEQAFPDWKNNPYIGKLPLFKRIFVKLAAERQLGLVRAMCRVHRWMTERE